MVFGLVVLAEPIADIMLSDWLETAILIQILTFYALFLALATPYEALFNGINKPEINRNRVMIMVVCNIFLNLILIPRDIQMLGGIRLVGLGARGAAIATVVSYFISLVYTRYKYYKMFKEKGNPRVIKHAIAALVMTAIIYYLLYGLEMISSITRWYVLLFFGFLGLGIYLTILVILKEFTKDDLVYYLDVLNIKKMLKYIKDEIKGN
jgi:O-antigen/teichoic acid export membrane protein